VRWPGRNGGGGVPPGFPGSGSTSRPSRPGTHTSTSPEDRVAGASGPARPARPARPRGGGTGEGRVGGDGAPFRFGAPRPSRGARAPHAPGDRAGAAPPRRRAPSHVRVLAWPGQSDRIAPEGFPGHQAPPHVEPARVVDRVVVLDGGRSDASGHGDGDAGEVETRAARRRRQREAVWRAAAAAPRTFQGLVAAVYAALADPLTSGSPEARARRTARVRLVGTVAASTAVGMLLVYAIFPVRTYVDQRSARQQTEEELEVLTDANDELSNRARELREREVVEEIARRDYGLVFPFEEPYAVLPPPVGTTTTAP
jgi:cell division protein FtsB